MNQPFASQIECVGLMDRGITGNFEVSIKETGELVHSKKRQGNKAESESDRQSIAVKIEMALEAMA